MASLLKFTSRKFLVALAAIVALIQHGESPWRVAVIGAVAALYICAEAYIDARGIKVGVPDVAGAIAEGLSLGESATPESTAATTIRAAPPPPPGDTLPSGTPGDRA